MAAQFGEHRGQTTAAEAFLKHPQRLLQPTRGNNNEAFRIEAETVETGAVKKSAFASGGGFEDDKERAIVIGSKAGKDRSGKAGGGSAVTGRASADLVKRGTGQTTAETVIKDRKTERERCATAGEKRRFGTVSHRIGSGPSRGER
jgi:hypothetical protein